MLQFYRNPNSALVYESSVTAPQIDEVKFSCFCRLQNSVVAGNGLVLNDQVVLVTPADSPITAFDQKRLSLSLGGEKHEVGRIDRGRFHHESVLRLPKSAKIVCLVAYASRAATQKRLSTRIVLNTAPANAHSQARYERCIAQKPNPISKLAHTIAQAMPQGVKTWEIAP